MSAIRKKQLLTILVWLSIFGIAMGFMESIVVVYIRKLYYPQGFHFPLTRKALDLLAFEWMRECTTIVMLVCVAVLAGRDCLMRYAFFLFSFASWDIFYYVGLKLLLDWPDSILAWDILFLIPITWLGPVLAPLICSLTMILLACSLLSIRRRGARSLKPLEWCLIFSGSAAIFSTFIWDYTGIIIREGYLPHIWILLGNERFLQRIFGYVPTRYHWSVFVCGEVAILSAIAMMFRRVRRRI